MPVYTIKVSGSKFVTNPLSKTGESVTAQTSLKGPQSYIMRNGHVLIHAKP